MGVPTNSTLKNAFFQLTNDRVLDAVEAALQEVKPKVRATGRVLPLNSLENRVLELELEDKTSVVTKFYRPGRWNFDQLAEEHRFLKALKDFEVPVIEPVQLKDSKLSKVKSECSSLALSQEGIYFAVFPKVRGRLLDELSKTQLETLGRYVARIHIVGKRTSIRHRLKLTPKLFGWESLEYLLSSAFLDANTKPHYKRIAEDFLRRAETKLEGAAMIPVHGDCHLGNTLWDGDAPFFLDFDDMMIAPPVQDIWMIIRGRDEEAKKQREILLTAYEQLLEFDWSTLDLIEPLRGLRILYYSAWIARRWDDPSFPNAFPNFGSPSYWRSDMDSLIEITELI